MKHSDLAPHVYSAQAFVVEGCNLACTFYWGPTWRKSVFQPKVVILGMFFEL